ncbi:MAG: hypothetical protein ACREVE_12035 [Gammaproteobacteria bacterium]
MQIICKVKEGRVAEAEKLVTDSISQVLSASVVGQVTVKQVFPGVTTGQRARLFTVNLPDQLSDHKLRVVMESLRSEDALEYAELPAEKQPM